MGAATSPHGINRVPDRTPEDDAEQRRRVSGPEGAALLARARRGDESAFRQLYRSHVDRTFGLAYRITGDEELARDATQEAFVRAFGRLDEFRGDAAFSTWLHRITVRSALNLVRDRARHRNGRVALDEEALPEEIPGASSLRRPAFELRDRIREAVDALPEHYRVVLLMHDVEGFTHREIAERLEVREGTSKARLSRARARLRSVLDEELLEYVP